jgi:hypothetical protein
MFGKNYSLKIQELLSQYLYQHKQLHLPGLGKFELNPSVNIYETKEEGWPPDTITFSANKHTPVDDDFINFLVQHSGKMKPLAMSDLESYLSSGTQLLNIGKPFPLKGIGSLVKLSNGDLAFQQGSPVLQKAEIPPADYILKDRTKQTSETEELSFASPERKNSRKLFIAIASVIALALIGWAIYLAIPKKEIATTDDTVQTDNTITSTDTVTNQAISDTTKADTAQVAKKDSIVAVPVPVVTASNGFKLVIETFPEKYRAEKRTTVLNGRGHKVTMEIQDSAHYNLTMVVMRPLSDTAYVIDSLRKFYRWRPQLVKQ